MALVLLPTILSLHKNNSNTDNMGNSATKTANTNAADQITIDKSGSSGLHIFEFHLPSAGVGATLFLLVLAALVLLCVARRYRLCKKLRPNTQPALPMVVQGPTQQPLVVQTNPAPPLLTAPQSALSPTTVYPSAPPLPPSMQKWAQ